MKLYSTLYQVDIIIVKCIKLPFNWTIAVMEYASSSHFPTYSKSAVYNFERSRQNHGKSLSIKVSLLKKVENIVAKGEIAPMENFLL